MLLRCAVPYAVEWVMFLFMDEGGNVVELLPSSRVSLRIVARTFSESKKKQQQGWCRRATDGGNPQVCLFVQKAVLDSQP